jgi:uncharacterized OsmC-like protein
METIRTIYLGELRTEATHLQSGNIVITDAPTDNQGKGEAYSPTDLLAAALGSCALTLMGIKAREHKLVIDGTKLKITKIMASNPRRVAEVVLDFDLSGLNLSEKERSLMEHTALHCPVAKSLHPELKQTFSFTY